MQLKKGSISAILRHFLFIGASIFLVSILTSMFANYQVSRAATPVVTDIYPFAVPVEGNTELRITGSDFNSTTTEEIENSTTGQANVEAIEERGYYSNILDEYDVDRFIYGEFEGTLNGITSQGGKDIFIQRIGNGPIGETQTASYFWTIGSAADDFAGGIGLDAEGNAYINGTIGGNAIAQDSGGSVPFANTTVDASFVSRIDRYGGVDWVRTVTNDTSQGTELKTRRLAFNDYEVYTTGYFENTVFFDGTSSVTSNGGQDIYLARYDQDGNLLGVTSDGGTDDDYGDDLAVAANGEVYVSGTYTDTVNFGAFNLTGINDWNGFAVKYDSSLTPVWGVSAESDGTGWINNSLIALPDETVSQGYIVVGYNTNSPTTFTGQVDFDHSPTDDAIAAVAYDLDGNFRFGLNMDGPDETFAADIVGSSSFSVVGSHDGGIVVDNKGLDNKGEYLPTEFVVSNGGYDVFKASYDRAGELNHIYTYGGVGDEYARSAVNSNQPFRQYVAADFDSNTTIHGNVLNTTGTDYFVSEVGRDLITATVNGVEGTFSDVSPQTAYFFAPPIDPGLVSPTQTFDLVLTDTESDMATIPNALLYYNNDNTAETLRTFGANDLNQLGLGNYGGGLFEDTNTPVKIVPDNYNVQNISSGENHSIALLDNNEFLSWGDNTYGQLGRGHNLLVDTPSADGSQTWTDVFAGTDHSLATSNSGDVYSWGRNNLSQLGDGTTTDTNSPNVLLILSGGSPFVQVSGGNGFSLALRNDGTVWAWGDNTYGQIGVGTTGGTFSTPEQIASLSNIVAIEGGGRHALALDSSGNVWAWGSNEFGQVGNLAFGPGTIQNTPVQVSGLSNIDIISGGNFFSGAVDNSGNLWTWGKNNSGELKRGTRTSEDANGGHGSSLSDATPTQVNPIGIGGSVTQLDLGGTTTGTDDSAHGILLNDNATALSWGDNDRGQLGGGFYGPLFSNTAYAIPKGTSFESQVVSAGGGFSVVANNSENPFPVANDDFDTVLEDSVSGVDIDVLANDTDEECVPSGGGGASAFLNPLLGVVNTYAQCGGGGGGFDFLEENGGFWSIQADAQLDFFSIDPTTVIISTTPSSGTITNVNPTTGVVTYVPDPNFFGNDTFGYQVRDNEGAISNEATVTVDVQNVNDLPTITSFSIDTLQGVDYPLSLLEFENNYNDIDGDPLDSIRIDSVPNPTQGSLILNTVTVTDGQVIPRTEINNLIYRPATGYNGSDSFDWNASDGTDFAVTNAQVNVNINGAPDVVDDNANTPQDTAVLVDVLANDSDPDGDAFDICTTSGFTQGTNGTVTQVGSQLQYTPNAGYIGNDSFTYDACDINDLRSTATVNLSVGVTNQNPDAVDDNVNVDENDDILVDVLANDTDPDSGDVLVICTPNGFTQGANGTVVQIGNQLRYTPNTDYVGSDSFTYDACDGNGGTDTATVNVTVNPVNNAPNAVDDTANLDEDTSVIVDVLLNDTDDDGDVLVICTPDGFTQGSNGTVELIDGMLRYTPNPDFNGDDSFTYNACDNNGGTDSATVNITVNPVNENVLPRTGGIGFWITFSIVISTIVLGTISLFTINIKE